MAKFNFNQSCESLLVQFKRRNSKKLTKRLESLCAILRQESNHVVQTKFGGSVQKGTYVTGLSDVDALSDRERLLFGRTNPHAAGQRGTCAGYHTTTDGFRTTPVKAGTLAVTDYSMLTGRRYSCCRLFGHAPTAFELPNLVPASGVISRILTSSPISSRKLTRQRDGRVVPVIKLAKAIADNFITRKDSKDQRIPHGVPGD